MKAVSTASISEIGLPTELEKKMLLLNLCCSIMAEVLTPDINEWLVSSYGKGTRLGIEIVHGALVAMLTGTAIDARNDVAFSSLFDLIQVTMDEASKRAALGFSIRLPTGEKKFLAKLDWDTDELFGAYIRMEDFGAYGRSYPLFPLGMKCPYAGCPQCTEAQGIHPGIFSNVGLKEHLEAFLNRHRN